MRTALVLFVLLLLIYVLFSGRLRQVFQAVIAPPGGSAVATSGNGSGGIGAFWRRITR